MRTRVFRIGLASMLSILIWADFLSAQIKLIPINSIHLNLLPSTKGHPSSYPSRLYRFAGCFYFHTGTDCLSVYTETGIDSALIKLETLVRDPDHSSGRYIKSPYVYPLRLMFDSAGLQASFSLGLDVFDARGQFKFLVRPMHRGKEQFFVKLRKGTKTYAMGGVIENGQRARLCNSLYVPVYTFRYPEDVTTDTTRSVRTLPGYEPYHYRPKLPIVAAIGYDPDGHSPPRRVGHATYRYRPVKSRIIETLGECNPEAIRRYRLGQYNPIAALHVVLWGDVHSNRLFYTTALDSCIFIHEPGRQLPRCLTKHGYNLGRIVWFDSTEINTGHLADRDAFEEQVHLLSMRTYVESLTEVQLCVHPASNLLLRVVSQPKPDQNRSYWTAQLNHKRISVAAIDSLRARTLQIYDLADGGRFVGEIEVPPLFRILEIDPQGLLWAVTGVEETAITVGRFRLVRE